MLAYLWAAEAAEGHVINTIRIADVPLKEALWIDKTWAPKKYRPFTLSPSAQGRLADTMVGSPITSAIENNAAIFPSFKVKEVKISNAMRWYELDRQPTRFHAAFTIEKQA